MKGLKEKKNLTIDSIGIGCVRNISRHHPFSLSLLSTRF
jgi:hypothetical protein